MEFKICDFIRENINRDFLLPSIQREFVWLNSSSDQKIEKLFDSILQGYPIGNLIAWRVQTNGANNTPLNMEVYHFIRYYDQDNPHNEVANPNAFANNMYIILDGQQRLTALNIGLQGNFSYTYYTKKKTTKLYLNLISNYDEDIDNVYGFKYEFKFLDQIPENDGKCWFEIGKVLPSNNFADFIELCKPILNTITDEQNSRKAYNTLNLLYSKICIDQILNVSEVRGDDEKALNVFVRTNEGGTKLEKSDILLSFMEYNKKIFQPVGARKILYDYVDSLNQKDLNRPNFGFKKDDVLKACLVMSDLPVQYKLINFNNTNLNSISAAWLSISKYLEMTVKLIGIFGFSKKNIVSKNSLIPIAYYLMHNNKSDAFIYSQNNGDKNLKIELIKWIVVSQLTGAFGAASDTTLKNVRDNIKDNNELKLGLGRNIVREDVEKWLDKESWD